MILGKRYQPERVGKIPWHTTLKDKVLRRLGYPVVDEPPPCGKNHKITPKIVKIETTNHCNADCVMCGHTLWPKDKLAEMPTKWVLHIIDEASAWKPKPIIQPDLIGEALCDSRIAEIVLYAHMRGCKTRIYTNGYNLSKRLLRNLADAGLDSISITIDGYTKEVYEKIRVGLRFETTVYNALDAWEYCRNNKNPWLEIGSVILPENKHELKLLREFWQSRCHLYFTNPEEASMPGRVDPLVVRKVHEHCFCWKAWRELAVRVNGDIPLCTCNFDWESKDVMGNAYDGKPLLDVFNSDLWNDCRDRIFAQVNVPPHCKELCFGNK